MLYASNLYIDSYIQNDISIFLLFKYLWQHARCQTDELYHHALLSNISGPASVDLSLTSSLVVHPLLTHPGNASVPLIPSHCCCCLFHSSVYEIKVRQKLTQVGFENNKHLSTS